MGRGTWKNFEIILFFRGGGSQFPGLGVPQRKDMKHDLYFLLVESFSKSYRAQNFSHSQRFFPYFLHVFSYFHISHIFLHTRISHQNHSEHNQGSGNTQSLEGWSARSRIEKGTQLTCFMSFLWGIPKPGNCEPPPHPALK